MSTPLKILPRAAACQALNHKVKIVGYQDCGKRPLVLLIKGTKVWHFLCGSARPLTFGVEVRKPPERFEIV